MRFFTLFPGMIVKVLDRSILISSGYEENDDPEDFLNLIAGKNITIREILDNDIYTCEEYPDVAIYKVFIERIITSDINIRQTALVYGISLSSVQRALITGLQKLKIFAETDTTLLESLSE